MIYRNAEIVSLCLPHSSAAWVWLWQTKYYIWPLFCFPSLFYFILSCHSSPFSVFQSFFVPSSPWPLLFSPSSRGHGSFIGPFLSSSTIRRDETTSLSFFYISHSKWNVQHGVFNYSLSAFIRLHLHPVTCSAFALILIICKYYITSCLWTKMYQISVLTNSECNSCSYKW